MKSLLAIILSIIVSHLAGETVIQSTISADSCYSVIIENILNEDFVILDIRTASEFSSGHIQNAVNIDYYSTDFYTQIDALDKSKLYIVHCKAGSRSTTAFSSMMNLGFNLLYEMQGGFNAWKSAGLPYTTSADTISYSMINASEAFALYDKGTTFIDLRTIEAYELMHIPNSINIPYNSTDFKTSISNLDISTEYVFYCKTEHLCNSTNLEEETLEFLYTNTFANISILANGVDSWYEAGYTTNIAMGLDNTSNIAITINEEVYHINTTLTKQSVSIYSTNGTLVKETSSHMFELPRGCWVITSEYESKLIMVNR